MKSPYLLISLLFLVSFTYLVTWSLYKLLIIKRNLHQKIWNVILLITFLIVAILGLLLAGQVNYKWEIQNIDKIVNWHVNFGIALAAVSIFHLLWHWSYYKNIFKKNKEKSNNKISDKLVVEEELPEDIHEKPISYQLILLGFSSIISQLVIIREFLSILSGNELLIGILFSNWMIITGLGAILGKNSYKLKNQFKFINSVIIAFPLISIAIIFAVNIFKNLVFHPGSIISIFQIFYSSFILLLPLCFLGGYLFTLLAFRFSESKKANTIDKSYGIEALGSVIGGIIFNFILVYFFKSIQILSIVIILNCLFIYFFINNSYPKIKQYILVILVLLISVTFLVIDFDTKAKKVLYRNQEIIHNENSPFGNIVITRNGDQLNFFENAVLYFSTDNVIENEEIVHYTMLQKENIENVLLISGGIKGLIDEILKYDIKSIDYVEINPRIIKIGRKYISFLDNKKLKIIVKDPSLFIKKTKKKYDIIIVDLPGPVNAGLNRFYTVEFAQSLKKVISINGFVCLKMPSTYNYISKTVSETQSIVFNSLKTVFDNVKIVPGEFNYFIASDENIRLDFTNLIQLKNINNDYVNEYYLDDYLILARSDYINSNLDSSAPVNQDFKPIAYFNSVLHRLSYFRFNYKIIVIIFCLLLIALFIILKPVSLGLFTVGFTATSLEYIILFTFQVIYGYVFQMIGIIVMIFMAGLAVGSYYGNKIIKTNVFKSFVNYQSILGLLSFVLVIVFVFLKEFALRPIIIHIIFICLTLSFSVITGLLFSVSTKIRINSIIDTAAKRYSVDLLGSAIGILLTSILLVPLIGIIYSLIFLAILNLLVAQIIKFRGMRNFS